MKYSLIVLTVSAAVVLAADKPQATEELVIAHSGGLKFRARLLTVDTNEGCDIADVNKDGKPDLIAGRNWYAAPDFIPRPLRQFGEFGEDYSENNGDHAYDVNADGWVDVVAMSFLPKEIHWYQNPGAQPLKDGKLWPQHLLADTGVSANEATGMYDLDKDGVPEFIVNSWNADNPTLAWKFAKDAKGQPVLSKIAIGPKGNGHGFGVGDVNGDGRADILVGTGWYEQPAQFTSDSGWSYHKDWTLPHASCPMLVVDVDGDGRNDLIWGNGHGYGLYWRRQLAPTSDGKTAWEDHDIDMSFSQAHCLHLADLDGDGQSELITGKRVRAHPKGDPGVNDPAVVYYYTYDRGTKKWTRYTLADKGPGIGLQIRTGDLNGDGRTDIAVAGKSGTYILFNEGR